MEIHADFNSKSQLKIGIFLTDENEFLFSFPGLCFCIPFLSEKGVATHPKRDKQVG